MERLVFALTHVAAQRMYKWLPPPAVGGLDCAWLAAQTSLGDDPVVLSAGDWLKLLEAGSAAGGLFEWFPTYAERFGDRGGRILALAAAQHFGAVRAAGGGFLAWCDRTYPALLREIADPPLGLTILGAPEILGRPAVSVIGSRRASGHAIRQSFELGGVLSRAGFVTVSGGALGCDIAAHQGVIHAERLAHGVREPTETGPPLPAIVVFAGGLHSLYPRANAAVFAALKRDRAVFLSERLFHAVSLPRDFPVRNRIIAGLAQTTVVMQAARKSGALITARQALDQGRELLVLMHPPGDVRASGSSLLLSEGARGFVDASELPGMLQTSHVLDAVL